jgi:hypothetical protein
LPSADASARKKLRDSVLNAAALSKNLTGFVLSVELH